MQKRLMATVAFYRELDPDPDAAAAALREAGYEVVKMPEKFRETGYDFMEVTKCIDEVKQVVEMMDDVETIVRPYEGMCREGQIVGTTSNSRIGFAGRKGEAGDEVEQGKQERSGE